MSDLNTLVGLMHSINSDCASLINTGTFLAKSTVPKERALGYEILASVSSIVAEQKTMLSEIRTVREEVGAFTAD